MLSDKISTFNLDKLDTSKITDAIESAAEKLQKKDAKKIDAMKKPSNLIASASKAASSAMDRNSPSNPSNTPNPIVVGVPNILQAPAVALFKLLGPCSPANKGDVRDGVKSDGSGGDGVCCDCGEGGVPVVGGGYVLKKTLDAIKKTQSAGLTKYVKGYNSGKLDGGQALNGIVSSLNAGLSTGNTELIPTAASIPIGNQAIELSLEQATKDGRTDWLNESLNAVGKETVVPYIQDNAGALATSLITRNDKEGIETMNTIDSNWSKWVEPGSTTLNGNLPSDLNDEQQYDILLAGSVTNEISVGA